MSAESLGFAVGPGALRESVLDPLNPTARQLQAESIAGVFGLWNEAPETALSGLGVFFRA